MFSKLTQCLVTQVRHVSKITKIGVLGVPFENGQPKVGTGNAPKYIRDGGLIQSLKDIHEYMDVVDYGDVSYKVDPHVKDVPNMKEYVHMVSCAREVTKRVTEIIKDGRMCLTLGGDHAIAVATVDGHIQAVSSDIVLIWVDAHADVNTSHTSDTGHTHGMPVALLAKELSDYWPYLPGMDWQKPVMSIKNLVYFGLRAVDSYERLIIEKLGILAFGMEEIETYGIDTCVNMALERIDPDKTKSVHVSFDIDSLDSMEAPCTGTPVRGGLTLREGIHIMEAVHRSGRLTAMDLVEVNPSLGSKREVDLTVDAAIHVIKAGFGFSRKGLKPKHVTDLPR
ncbi:hypothetical protein FQR65_LT03693 [Abscondita terminalis]|nr:hypothetical protein FQR65_LT03693 [Abscondita terminalis]